MQAPFIWSGGINFTHGIASGYPFDTSVLLWTRAVPTGSTQPDDTTPVCVSYGVYTNQDLSGSTVDAGQAFTSAEVDWTVKVEASLTEVERKDLIHLTEETRFYLLVWSVTRL